MKAAVLFEAKTPLEIVEVDIDTPGPREVLIRTAAVGVCRSDLHFVDGSFPHPMPTVPGHEAAGIVEAVGEGVSSVKPGDHVITFFTVFCGSCEMCITGRPSLCVDPSTRRAKDAPPRLKLKDGRGLAPFLNLSAYAEMMLVHENACVAISKDMPLDRAALIGCAVTTGMGAVTNTAKIPVGATVAVIGCGGVGLSAINGAAIAGAGRIIAVDIQPGKLDLARAFGATDVVNAREVDPVGAVLEMTSGGVEYSFEALGLKATAEQAYQMLRRSGTATVIGMVPKGQMLEIDPVALLMDRRIQGSNMGSNRFRVDMPRYVDFYMAGRLHLDRMIAGRIALDQINDGFETLRRGELARSVVTFAQ